MIIGTQILDLDVFQSKLSNVKALLFDWDGVFHSGYKNEHQSSMFSEADSMGVNMLRFGFFLKHNAIPYTAIITGEDNKTAYHWGKREHLNDIFYKVKDKTAILNHLKTNHNIKPDEVLFVFDDILDLNLAKQCGVRMMCSRQASALLNTYCVEQKLCDYLTANDGANHGVREICEHILHQNNMFEHVIQHRMDVSSEYKHYLKTRQNINTNIGTL